MQSTSLSFANLHNHGELFANVLRARREAFILNRGWDLPETMGMEYDQYDTPQSRWIAVHEAGHVYAGVRLTPTTARCGVYSYMIRDAQDGFFETIPHDLLFDQAPRDDTTWELSRGFIVPDLPASLRRHVRSRLVHAVLKFGRTEGIGRMIALLPASWNRWAWTSRTCLSASAAGRNMNMGGTDYQAVWIDFTTQLH